MTADGTPPAIPRALTIAGSDSGGGAGIQADLKTFTAFDVYGMSVVTAVTAQNTLGVQAAHELPLNLIEAQLRGVTSDIGVDAVKTGMLSSAPLVHRLCDLLEELRLPNLVVDPVMIAKGGRSLLAEDAVTAVRDRLLPLAKVVTPNLHEAGALTGRPVSSLEDAHAAARRLRCADGQIVVVKGGHLSDTDEAVDSDLRRRDGPRARRAPLRNAQHPRDGLHLLRRHRRGVGPGPTCHRGGPQGQVLRNGGGAALAQPRRGPRPHLSHGRPGKPLGP